MCVGKEGNMFEQEISIVVLNNREYLDRDCWNCDIAETEERKNCEYCGGIGFIPTELGNEILAFMLRHSKLEE